MVTMVNGLAVSHQSITLHSIFSRAAVWQILQDIEKIWMLFRQVLVVSFESKMKRYRNTGGGLKNRAKISFNREL